MCLLEAMWRRFFPPTIHRNMNSPPEKINMLTMIQQQLTRMDQLIFGVWPSLSHREEERAWVRFLHYSKECFQNVILKQETGRIKTD